MALLTVAELEAAMGVTFTDADVGRAQYYINGLSAYIQTKTRCVFEEVVDDVERFRADPYGIIQFNKLPVTAVTTIHDFQTDTDLEPGGWIWDGIDKVTNLCGYQVVDVTYSHGAPVTDDVKWAATEAVKRGMDSTAQANLVLKQVGDVIHQYSGMLPLTEAEQEIFDFYGTTEWTVRLDAAGPHPHQYYGYYPWDVTRSDYYGY